MAVAYPKWPYSITAPVVRDRTKNNLICAALEQCGCLPTDLDDVDDLLSPHKPIHVVVMFCGDSKYRTSVYHMNLEMQTSKYSSNSASTRARRIATEIGGDEGYIDACHDVLNSGIFALRVQRRKRLRHKYTNRQSRNLRRSKGHELVVDMRKTERIRGNLVVGLVFTRAPSNRYLTHADKMFRPFYLHHGLIVRILIAGDWQVCMCVPWSSSTVLLTNYEHGFSSRACWPTMS